MDGEGLTGLLGNAREQLGPDGQLVGSITQRHERTLEGAAVNRAPNLHDSSCLEMLG